MEGLGGFRSFPAIEEVAITFILLCAALNCLKSEMESLMGFKFHPSKEQIFNLLDKKRLDPHFLHHTIKDIDDICSFEPWDLPGVSETESEEQFWYFFYEPFYKYKESCRAHRRTNAGYWKITGRGSEITTKNGLTGSKKILTFYRRGPASKKAKTEWVMHEFHVKDNPSYKKEFVLCRIERKWNKQRGISTTDEGGSSQLLVSPTQLLPSDHSISSVNHIEENPVTNPQPQPPNYNLISYSGNHITQNTHSNIQIQPNHNVIKYPGNHIVQNTLSNPQLLPNHNVIEYPGNHIVQNTLSNPQLLPNHKVISYPGNHIVQNTLSNSQQLPDHNMIYYPRNHIEENILTNPQLQPTHNLISIPRNDIEENTSTKLQLPPNCNSDLQLLANQNLAKNNVAKYTLQEENFQLGEFNASSVYNGLNNASFSTLQSPMYQEQEFTYSNSSFDNCYLLNSQIDSEQVYDLNNLERACHDENSRKETGQTLTPDCNSSKSDGGAYAEDSSDRDTETLDAWVNEQLEFIAQVENLNDNQIL